MKVAKDTKIDCVYNGVYVYQTGPTFESPTEVKLLRMIGGDVVGMSTVPEVLVACHRGIRCLGISLVTTKCVDTYDSDKKRNQDDAVELTKKRSCELQKLISKAVEALNLTQVEKACAV